jgi:hypothetical protein
MTAPVLARILGIALCLALAFAPRHASSAAAPTRLSVTPYR